MKTFFSFLSFCLLFILGFGTRVMAKTGTSNDDYWFVLSLLGVLFVIAGLLYLYDLIRAKVRNHHHSPQ